MSKGKLTIVQGDVTNPQYTAPNEVVVIPHVCNNRAVMGAGVAHALRKKWPSVFDDYTKMDRDSKNQLILGDVCFSKVSNNIIVANMVSQDGFIGPGFSIPLKYASLIRCMERVRDRIKNSIIPESVVIHTPMFGSDLAGGNWDFILELIRELWIESGINVVVYEFHGSVK